MSSAKPKRSGPTSPRPEANGKVPPAFRPAALDISDCRVRRARARARVVSCGKDRRSSRKPLLAPQFPKEFQVEARIAPAIAGQAQDRGDLPAFVLFDFNAPPCASRCRMRCSLREMSIGEVPGKTTKAAAARHRGTGFQVFCLPRLGGQGFTGTERKWTSTLHWNGVSYKRTWRKRPACGLCACLAGRFGLAKLRTQNVH